VAKTWSQLQDDLVLQLDSVNPTPSLGLAPTVTAYPSMQEMESTQHYAHATKADDATIPTHFWDERVWAHTNTSKGAQDLFKTKYSKCALESLRNWLMLWWRWNVTRSLCLYLRNTYGPCWPKDEHARRDIEVGRDCMFRTSHAD
jgi:hypothetical protein